MASLVPIISAAFERESDADHGELDAMLARFAIYCGLAPLIYHINTPAIDGDGAKELRGADLSARLHSGNQLEILQGMFADDATLRQNLVLLKGMALALSCYPLPHLRPMADVDVLVPSQTLQRQLEQRCLENGFVKRSPLPEDFYIGFHHSMPLLHVQKNVWLEIHTDLFPRRERVAHDPIFAPEFIQQQAVWIDTQVLGRVRILSPELNLLYTCVHWALENNWMKCALRMVDVLYLLNAQSTNMNWETILQCLRQSPDTATATYLMLSFIERQFPAMWLKLKLPPRLLAELNGIQTRLNRANTRVLHAMIRRHAWEDGKAGPLLNADNSAIVWSTLMFSPKPAWFNLLCQTPCNLLFPPSSEQRFSLSFQLSRLRNMLFRG